MARVLIVEDDSTTAAAIRLALEEEGHACECADDGRAGMAMAVAANFDVIVLDRLLPGLDGLGLLAALRAAGIQTPVLILSALSTLDERVQGLRAGGDDYLAKPFEMVELLARIGALLRRGKLPESDERETELRVGDLNVNLLTREVSRGTRILNLVPKEYDLLVYLMRHAGKVATRTMLFEAVWNYRYDDRTNVIDVHIGRLRRKVDSDSEKTMIQTVRGAGYVLKTSL